MLKKNKSHQIRFLDSFKFLSDSLDKLTSSLSEDQFNILPRYFTKKQLPLVKRKGVFPYDWLDCFEKLEETQLPPKEKFYSSLNKEHVNEEDYEHALNVWKTFNMKTFKDYLELYNKVDVLLLTDIIENFRDAMLKNFGLDPAWYYTLPGYGWDAMLKISEIKYELLSDRDQLHFWEEGKRGGISMCSKRYSKANNKYMGDAYDPSKPSKYLLYIDKNSLYPWAMSKPLPISDFKNMTDEELENWENYPCLLEVDLDYPEELHDEHNAFSLAPERLKVGKVGK